MKNSFRFGIIQKFIFIVALFAMVTIWPMQLYPVTQVSTGQYEDYIVSNPSTEERQIRQDFVPLYENIQEISVFVSNDPDSVDSLLAAFRIYDSKGQCLYEKQVQIEDYALPGMVSIPIQDVTFVPEELYFYTFTGLDGELFLGYFEDYEQKSMETGEVYYCNGPNRNRAVITSYTYKRDMGTKRIIFGDCAIALVVIFLLVVLERACNGVKKQKWEMIETVVKCICYGLTALLQLIFIVGIVFLHWFTADWLNILVLVLGVLLLGGYVMWRISVCPSETKTLEPGERTKRELVAMFIRGILWALVFIFTALNNNAMTDYEKGLHLREMIAAMCVLLYSYQNRKWLFHVPALLWSIVSVVAGHFYILAHNDHMEHLNTANRTVWAVWAVGLLVYHLILLLVETRGKELKKLNWFPFLVTILFMALNGIFHYGNTWAVWIVVAMPLIYLHYMLSPMKKEYLEDMVKGMLIMLIGVTIFCVCRRPFHYFMHTRYGGIFFTVTSTALFLCVPIAAALSGLMAKSQEKWQNKSGYIMLLGIGLSYVLFTVSRTGMLAIIMMVLFAVAFCAKGLSKQAWIIRGKQLLCIISGFLFCLPIMYSATRMGPAMVGNPLYFGFEKGYVYFNENTPWDSENYITVKRFAGLVLENVFSVEDAYSRSMFWDRYGFEKPSYTEKLENENVQNKTPDSTESTVVKEDTKKEEVAQPHVDSQAEQDIQNDYTNGRIDVFKGYLKKVNLKGHTGLGITLEDGEEVVHAHNSYIQMAYSFGWMIGILFLVFAFVIFLQSILYALKKNGKEANCFFPLMVTVAFGVASMVEFVYYPCIPLGLLFMMMPPVLFMSGRR